MVVWHSGNVVCRISKVTSMLSPVSNGMGDRLWVGILIQYVCNQANQINSAWHPSGVAELSTSFSWLG